MGLTDRQLLWRVELPLALPAIIAGLRIAATTTVGLAALAFFAGAGGLGEQMLRRHGVQSNVVVARRAVRAAGGRARRILLLRPARCSPRGRAGGRHDARLPRRLRRRARLHRHQARAVRGGAQVGGTPAAAAAVRAPAASRVVAVAIATAIALPLGLWLGHSRRGSFLVVSVTNVGRAVPSHRAGLPVLRGYLGAGFFNITLALVLLAIPPILLNAYVGVRAGRPRRGRRRPRHGPDRRADPAPGRAAAGAAARLRRHQDLDRQRHRHRHARPRWPAS